MLRDGQDPAPVDVLVVKDQVPAGLLLDAGDPAFDESRAHGLGLFVELLVALGVSPDVHAVDGHVSQGQGTHDELVVLERIHAAEPGTEGVPHGLVARTGAEDEGYPLRDLAVARTEDGVVGSGRSQQPVHLHAGDDVGIAPVAVLRLEVGREELEPGREDDRPHLELALGRPHLQAHRAGRAHRDTLVALGADPAVKATAGALPGSLLAQGSFDLQEVARVRDESLGVLGRVHVPVRLLPGQNLLLIDHR